MLDYLCECGKIGGNKGDIMKVNKGDIMKIRCLKNPEHKSFITTVHVMQEWITNENGDFNRVNSGGECLEVTAGPDPDNIWTCYTCGAEAVVEK